MTVRAGPAAGWPKQPDTPYYGRTDGLPTNTRPSGIVTFTGTLQDGEVLTANDTLVDPDTLGAYSYLWTPATLAGTKTGSTYTCQTGDVGKVPNLTISYTDGAGQSESKTSTNTAAIVAAGGTAADVPAIYLPTKPSWAQTQLLWIHFSVPTHVYPGVDVDYKMTGYDWFNRTLQWSLTANPTGATIDADTGVISWTPTTPGQDGDNSFTVRLTAGGSDYVEISWTANSATANGIFYSTTGNDTTGDGSISTPYATLDKATGDLVSATGATIYARGGTYTEFFDWYSGTNPVGGMSFTSAEQVRITSYPGETAINDCNSAGEGPVLAGYVTWDGIEIRNGIMNNTSNNTGGITVPANSVVKRTIVRDTHYPDNQNCSGFCTHSGAVTDSCTGIDNYDTTPFNWNNSNWVHYADRNTTGGDAFVIDCLSEYTVTSSTHSGYKIKHGHATGGKIHYHRSVAKGGYYSFAFGFEYCSINGCVWSPQDNASGGVAFGITDNGFNDTGALVRGGMGVIESATGNSAVVRVPNNATTWSTTTSETGPYFKDVILISSDGGSTDDGTPAKIYDATSYDLNFVGCEFFTPDNTRLMYDNATPLAIADINALANSSGNTYGGTSPATKDFVAGGGTTLGPQTWRWTKSTNTLAIV